MKQVNGTRMGAGPTSGGANLELGGGNSGQLVEYVKSFDPRSWSCMHFFEGSLNCRNATIRYNDIGAFPPFSLALPGSRKVLIETCRSVRE